MVGAVIVCNPCLILKSVLDDDDVALIDLVSKADIGRENAEKSSYYAETYDKNGKVAFCPLKSIVCCFRFLWQFVVHLHFSASVCK